MKYLGYEWENQVSILASRITLHLQKEIKLSFLSEAQVEAVGKYDKEPKEYTIKGFCLSRYFVRREVLESMVEDLPCIHINKRYENETVFTVCAYPSVMQAWYDMMWKGSISTKVIKDLGDKWHKASEEEVETLHKKHKATTTRCFV